MADPISDPRLETLLRGVLSAEVANLPVTVQPNQILERAEARRRARARSRLRLLVFGEPTSGLRQLSVAMGAIAVLAVAGALAIATLRLDRTNVAAPLPTTPDAWSRVAIDAGPHAQNVTRIAASPDGLLAVVDVEDGPAELFASTDGQSWTKVPPAAHPAIKTDGVGWALTGSDRGFLLSNGDVWSSNDGFGWQLLASRGEDPDLGHGEMLAVAAGGPGYVAVGAGNSAWYSTDGSDWSLAQVPPPPTQFFESQGFETPEVAMRGIAVARDHLVAFGTASRHTESSGLTAPVVWTSRDGRTWSNAVDPLDGEGPSAVAAGPGGFAVMTDEGGQRVVRVSADGSTWEQVAELGAARSIGADGTPLDLDVSAIAASDAGFVAVGGFGPRCLMAGVPCGPDEAVIWMSADGRSWSRLPSAELFARAGASDIVAWGDRFVMGGARDGRPVIWMSGTPRATETPTVTPTPAQTPAPRSMDPTPTPQASEQDATTDADVTELLNSFLEARVVGEGAEQYVTADSPDEEVPLLYTTSSGARYERAEFEGVDGVEWPYEWTAYTARLFAGDIVVEQLLFVSNEDGRLELAYKSDGFGTDIAPTTENGRPVPAPYDAFDGDVTLYLAHPWVSPYATGSIKLIPEGARPTTDGGERNAWYPLVVVANPSRTGPDCPTVPGPIDAEALAESIRSDPELEATAPVTVGAGGTEGLMMDVLSPVGLNVGCGGLLGDGLHEAPARVSLANLDPVRLYLFDAPEGLSMEILAVAINVPEPRFARAVDWPGPIVEFHAP